MLNFRQYSLLFIHRIVYKQLVQLSLFEYCWVHYFTIIKTGSGLLRLKRIVVLWATMPAIEVTAPIPVDDKQNEEENYKTPVIGIIYPPPEVRSILIFFILTVVTSLHPNCVTQCVFLLRN